MVLDESLPTGILANSAAALSLSVGKLHPELVGYDIQDRNGYKHNGITSIAMPILKGGNNLNKMREALKEIESEVTVVDIITVSR